MLTADDLLAGPRGRGLCLAVARRLDDGVGPAAFYAARDLADDALRQTLVTALNAVDVSPVRGWSIPLACVEAMDESVSNAMYWQPPHGEDDVAADPAVAAALRPVADALAASAVVAWWVEPVDLAALRYTVRFTSGDRPRVGAVGSPPLLQGAEQRLQQWRRGAIEDERRAAVERRADPSAPFSSRWWSTPAMASLVTTTRALAGVGSVALLWEEDSFGDREAHVWPVQPVGRPRVWEVDGPRAWVDLVERYPLEVSASRRHDWYRTTGRAGAWCIPDWAAVAQDWDAVHVSVAGYLTTATRALDVADGATATVLAGWDPDQTWWLTDALTTTTTRPEQWVNPHDLDGPDFAWRQQP